MNITVPLYCKKKKPSNIHFNSSLLYCTLLCHAEPLGVSCRPQSSGIIQHAKRNTPEDKVKPTSAYGDTHKYLPPTETHTPPHNDTRPMAPASGEFNTKITYS